MRNMPCNFCIALVPVEGIGYNGINFTIKEML